MEVKQNEQIMKEIITIAQRLEYSSSQTQMISEITFIYLMNPNLNHIKALKYSCPLLGFLAIKIQPNSPQCNGIINEISHMNSLRSLHIFYDHYNCKYFSSLTKLYQLKQLQIASQNLKDQHVLELIIKLQHLTSVNIGCMIDNKQGQIILPAALLKILALIKILYQYWNLIIFFFCFKINFSLFNQYQIIQFKYNNFQEDFCTFQNEKDLLQINILTKLQSFSLYQSKLDSQILNDLIQKINPRLLQLNLKSHQLKSNTLLKLLKRFSHLNKLDFSQCQINDQKLQTISDIKCSTINTDDNQNITNEGIKKLISTNHSIKIMSLRINFIIKIIVQIFQISLFYMFVIFSLFKNCVFVNIKIDLQNISQKGITYLRKLKYLIHLHISYEINEWITLNMLSKLLVCLKKLKILYFCTPSKIQKQQKRQISKCWIYWKRHKLQFFIFLHKGQQNKKQNMRSIKLFLKSTFYIFLQKINKTEIKLKQEIFYKQTKHGLLNFILIYYIKFIFSDTVMLATKYHVQDQRFQEIITAEGLHIQDYYEPLAVQNMFPDAITYPSFFNNNLVSPNRILKLFNNNVHSNIRIFYLQILRLSYQIELQQYSSKIFIVSLRRIVFHPEFEIYFTEETDNKRDIYNDFQFKKFFAQFLNIMDKQLSPNVLQIFSHYPIMDTVFIHILRSILATKDVFQQFDAKIPTEIVFGVLTSLVQLSITSYGTCWKFDDSDMFCYEDNENQLYLAYITQDSRQVQYVQNTQTTKYSNCIENSNHSKESSSPSNIQTSNIAPSTTRDMQKSMNSQKPSASMISQNYQFTDYLGKVTIEKHRIPRQQKQKQDGLARNLVNKINNNVKSSFTFEISNKKQTYQQVQNHKKLQQKLKKQSYGQKSQKSQFKYPQFNFKSNNLKKKSRPKRNLLDYKQCESSHTKGSVNTDSTSYRQSDSHKSNTNQHDKHEPKSPSPTYKSLLKIKKKPSFTFKRIEPITLPKFETFKSTYVQQKKQKYLQRNQKPSISGVNYITSPLKPLSKTPQLGDYFNDFTSPDILSKLRTCNRQNICKIRQAMKGINKGTQLPPDFDVRKSAIHNSGSSPQIQIIQKSQSNGQLKQIQSFKPSKPSKPSTADISLYKSNKNVFSKFIT